MFRRNFSHSAIENVVCYARMSLDSQNPASPEQQQGMIRSRMRSCGFNWKILDMYRDDGETGRLVRNRPGFLRMLSDIKLGRIKIEAILVDTIERFGRMEDLDKFRRDLHLKHHVAVLCADRNFADPFSADGRIASAFENVRAAEDSRIKGHTVLRGKYHAIDMKYWPGGPVPFGLKLELVTIDKRGGREWKHHRLVPDPETFQIMVRQFMQSLENPTWGQTRLAKWLNAQPDIPDKFKPFLADTVGKRLRNPIYCGELVWDQNATGIIDDVRVLERNNEEDVIRVPDFCEPIVPREVFDQVQAYHRARTRDRENPDCSRGPGSGVNYRYPLTGLVRCGHCNASMVPNSSSTYKAKSGEERNYCSYVCPNSHAGSCRNRKRIKEDWLRSQIIGKLRERLFPDGLDGIESLEILCKEVQRLVDQSRRTQRDQADSLAPILEAERKQLAIKIQGWSESLAKPGLNECLRVEIEGLYGTALSRTKEIDLALERERADNRCIQESISKDRILASLERLHEVLAGDCANLTNLELSTHIDRIDCFEDGRVVSRTCKLGSVPMAIQWFQNESDILDAAFSRDHQEGYQTTPRRRARMQIDGSGTMDEAMRSRLDMATDPERFAGLPKAWFWVDEYRLPEPTFWAKENAQVVLRRYQEVAEATGKKPSQNKLAKEFDVSRPTITHALDLATNGLSEAPVSHRKGPGTKVKGNAELEAEIERLHDEGYQNKVIAKQLGISRSTVTNALDRIYERRGTLRPDGRKTRHEKR